MTSVLLSQRHTEPYSKNYTGSSFRIKSVNMLISFNTANILYCISFMDETTVVNITELF